MHKTADDDDFEPRHWLITFLALKLVQAMGQSHASVPFWFVSRRRSTALGTVSNPRHAGLWGLASVAAAEYADAPRAMWSTSDPKSDERRIRRSRWRTDQTPRYWHAHRGSRDIPICTSTRALDSGLSVSARGLGRAAGVTPGG